MAAFILSLFSNSIQSLAILGNKSRLPMSQIQQEHTKLDQHNISKPGKGLIQNLSSALERGSGGASEFSSHNAD